MRLHISVHNSQGVHILENHSHISCNLDSGSYVNLVAVFLHVEQVEKTKLHVFENYVNVWDVGDHSHQHAHVGMAQDSLHHDLILDLLQKLLAQPF